MMAHACCLIEMHPLSVTQALLWHMHKQSRLKAISAYLSELKEKHTCLADRPKRPLAAALAN